MPTSPLSEVMERLRRTVLLPDRAAMTDGQLLSRFVEGRDEDAFAALVKRHGPMVWGVCRRLLPNHHDAEDAFQATFLVLVRKAATVRPREMVANWLYGVAYMTTQRGRATAAKARRRERQVAEMPEPTAAEPDLWEDLRAVLHQELARLPDPYRVVVVLCDLEGKTRKEVARQLGPPKARSPVAWQGPGRCWQNGWQGTAWLCRVEHWARSCRRMRCRLRCRPH